MQTTLTRLFIVLESVSQGLSENSDKISRKARKFEGFFRPKSGGLQKKKVFGEIETDFSAEIRNSNVWGGLFSYGVAFFNFSQKIGLKSTKIVQFCILHKPMGGSSPPAFPLATLLTSPMQLKINHKKSDNKDCKIYLNEIQLTALGSVLLTLDIKVVSNLSTLYVSLQTIALIEF